MILQFRNLEKPCYLKYFSSYYLSLFLIFLVACKTPDKSLPTEAQINEAKAILNIKLNCYQNAMPMANGGSYIIISVMPSDTILQENIKILEMTATGSKANWSAQYFDVKDYAGKGQKSYQNIARGFDQSIGGPYDFTLKIQFESGTIKTYKFKGLTIQSVY